MEIIKQISPTAWQHINFMGRYEFNKSTEKINVSEIVKELCLIPLPKPQIPYWYFSWVWAENPCFQINQNCAVIMAFAKSEIVNPKHSRRLIGAQGKLPNPAQQSVGTNQ